MTTKIKTCKLCQTTSDISNWRKVQGKITGFVCLKCYAVKQQLVRSTPAGREKHREAGRKAAAASRATAEGLQRSREAGVRCMTKRREIDPIFKAQNVLRCLLTRSLSAKGFRKNSKSAEILGADFETVMKHLGCVNGIPEGMAVDHILPMALARNEADAVTLNHYTNLQLLTQKENIDKWDWVAVANERARARDLSNEQAAAIIEEFRRTIK